MIRLFLVAVLFVAGCTYPTAGAGPSPTVEPPAPTAKPTGASGKAIEAELKVARVVAVRPEVAGYKRDQFGQSWTDNHNGPGGHNGCDTRNDILAAQLTAVHNRTAKSCVVVEGTLTSEPYTGRRVEFRKAAATKVQIDHIYPLARAWDMGAARWPAQRRVDFANDQAANLLAVDGPANASKNDSGPGEWMPLNKAFRCVYVLRYLQVAHKYALPITAADRDTARTIAPTCK
ncbi:HNH endonuclease family protein [Kribbella sp. NPDC051770]|uniref:HNH endonuclease family protein n=1 Tax=Kribbella sp. NPDC051770 TaxID=3155413 RepID=UPI00341E95C5